MLSFNFLRGNGVSMIMASLMFILVVYIKNKITLKKQLNH